MFLYLRSSFDDSLSDHIVRSLWATAYNNETVLEINNCSKPTVETLEQYPYSSSFIFGLSMHFQAGIL